ncbi:MAG: hypothetical protein AB7O66_21445 [Limisphaerales bacterium]
MTTSKETYHLTVPECREVDFANYYLKDTLNGKIQFFIDGSFGNSVVVEDWNLTVITQLFAGIVDTRKIPGCVCLPDAMGCPLNADLGLAFAALFLTCRRYGRSGVRPVTPAEEAETIQGKPQKGIA